jgi:hypothetical protein
MAFAERTALELLCCLRLDPLGVRSRPARACGGEGNEAPGERVLPKVDRQEPEFVRSRKGLIRSSGAGKTIVVDCEAPSSSNVWR